MRYVYFLTPKELGVIGRMRLRSDNGEIMEAVHDTVADLPALVVTIPDSVPNGVGCTRYLEADGYIAREEHGILRLTSINPVTNSVAFESDMGTLEKAGSRPFVRSGIVRAAGRSFQDNEGFFYPLGETLFWAPRGWKFENDRIKKNIEWAASYQVDANRILCAVGWPGNENDPTWPDYQQVLAELIDWTYDQCGMRTIATIWGGGHWDPLHTTDLVCNVIRDRKHKILYAEAVNESFNNLPDVGIVREMSRRLMATGVLTVSSCLNPPTMEQYNELALGCSNMTTVHLDRSYGDLDWRFVRQPWDVKQFPGPCSQGEPKGPGSSVSPSSNPLQLAHDRLVGIICGAGSYVIHNAAGVYGIPNNNAGGGHRTANLWEMPGIDAVMRVVRKADSILPIGVEGWRKANDGWRPPLQQHPLPSQEFWEGDSINPNERGVNKNYCAIEGAHFVCTPAGIKNMAHLRATWPCTVRVYDTELAELVIETDLDSGEDLLLPGVMNSMRAYTVVGDIH